MSFSCLTVHKNWTALAPEESLIKRYREQSYEVCEWNGVSFGPHDPGRDRETTNKDTEGFDVQFPIRDDWPCDFVDAREWNVRELLIRIKKGLPFLLRYEAVNKKYRKGHPDYNNLVLTVPAAGMPVSELLRLVTRNLPGVAVHEISKPYDPLQRSAGLRAWNRHLESASSLAWRVVAWLKPCPSLSSLRVGSSLCEREAGSSPSAAPRVRMTRSG
jgi:hypothetical protein